MAWTRRAAWTGMSALAAMVAAPAAKAAPGGAWRLHRDHVLGTSLDVTIIAARRASANRAFAAIEQEIGRLEPILSGWRTNSELAALNRAARHHASPDLFAVIAACESWRDLTVGAYCARLGQIETIWKTARTPPDPRMLRQQARDIQASAVALDAEARTIARPEPVRFAIDGLAKGYIIDRALDAARRAAPDMGGALINLGGDIRARGAQADAGPWRVGLADGFDNIARAQVVLNDKAIAVSGPGTRDLEVGASRVSHILSPFDGAALSAPNRAAVIASRAADADALATALAVLPPEQGVRLINAMPDAAALVVDASGRAIASDAWNLYAAPPGAAPLAAALCQAVTSWPAGFALALAYEIPRLDAANYKRPYVVVWISDEQRKLVRTLQVLGDRPRWRESNYVWWRRFERLTPEAVQALARPTRAPGRYDLLWDGRDDQGRAVGQGRYTLNIEAAREHGGHSFQAIDLDLRATPLSAGAAAQAEIGATSVRYGPRP